MQIDLANTLVHKAYFVYYVLFIISPQAWAPLLRRGWGRLLGRLPGGGFYNSALNFSSMVALLAAPTNLSTSSPFLKNRMVGMLRTP